MVDQRDQSLLMLIQSHTLDPQTDLISWFWFISSHCGRPTQTLSLEFGCGTVGHLEETSHQVFLVPHRSSVSCLDAFLQLPQVLLEEEVPPHPHPHTCLKQSPHISRCFLAGYPPSSCLSLPFSLSFSLHFSLHFSLGCGGGGR